MKKRIVSMLIAICIIFSTMPMSVFAQASSIGGGTSSAIDSGAFCLHTEHDETCGYIQAIEGAACTHLGEDGNYTCTPLVSGNEASPSDAEYVCEHSDSCGFVTSVEASLCTHACELCKPLVEVTPLPLAKECDCIVKCTASEGELEAVINADCPVCGAKDADLEVVCKPQKEMPPLAKECDCIVKCTASDVEHDIPANIDTECKLCGAEGANLADCIGTGMVALSTGFGGGDGTSADTAYTISTADQLALLATNLNSDIDYSGKFFKMTATIDLASISPWTPIGKETNKFKGTFDGGGFEVQNLTTTTADHQGLFSYVDVGGTVQNVGVTGTVSGKDYVGGVVGNNSGTVQNCYNTGTVSGISRFGGVVGNNSGTVQNCYNTGTVSGTVTGTVSGNNYVGGVMGNNSGTVQNCYNTGTVSGTNRVGGVVGHNSGTVQNCYNTGNVRASLNYAGGVVGYNYQAAVANCYNTGNVSISGGDVNSCIGGVAGRNYSGTATNCVSLGLTVTVYFAAAAGRVTSTESGLSGNKARVDMKVKNGVVTKGLENNKDGADVLVDGNVDQSDVFSEWDTDIWAVPTTKLLSDGVLPTLVGAIQNPAPTLPADLDIAIVAAAKSAVRDGEVSVAFGAEQTVKTTAVQTYVDGLLVNSGVVATVTFKSGNVYTVELSKGNVTDSKDITMIINEGPAPILTGTVTIDGMLKFNQQLTASVTGNHSGTLSYQWKRGTADIGTGSTYTTVADDIGQILTCVLKSSGTTGYISGDTTGTIAKVDGTAPAAPTTDYVAEKLTTTTTLEYKVSGVWTLCADNMLATAFGWNGDSEVSVQFRTVATATQEASAEVMVIIPERPSAPPASKFTVTQPAKGGNDGELNGITAEMEYKVSTDATYTNGSANLEIKRIADGTAYHIRTKATTSAFASATVTVTVASKLSATVNFKNATVPYNGMEQTLKATTTDSSGGTMTYVYTAPSGGSLNTNGKPQNAGTYTVTATYESTTHFGSATATLTINKVNVIITADNKTVVIGEALPTYTATTTGLVGGETISTITFIGGPTDSNTKGTHEITPNGGTITGGGNGNYTISYATGTLTITLATEVIDTAIASANAAKIGITTNENDPSSVASGTKFVKAAEMKALTDAITTATAAKATVGTATEAQAAATALDDAVATFTAAIKTGTYTYIGGGGGGGVGGSDGSDGGGSSSNTPVVTPTSPSTTPTILEQVEAKVETKVDASGNLTVTVKNKDITDAIAKAKTTANGITIVLNASGSKTANSVNINLPKAVQETIINKKIVNIIVAVDNPNIKIGMDLSTIKEINAQAKAEVNLTATRMDSGKLTGNAKTAIGTRPAFDLKVNYGSGKQIQTFGTGSMSVTIPYTLGANEKAGNVYAVYVNANGIVQWLTGSVYDSTAKVLRFSTNHFSTYGVGYKATNVAFTDTANHWAKDDIEFVASRGLLSGTSATAFSPDTAMTKGMFVTALGRLTGIDVNRYKTSKFSDVSTNAYYAPYVNWAAEKSITTGTNTTTFSPDKAITRQEMAVIMQNYAKAMGYTVSKTRTAVTFSDSSSIANWASESVKSMQQAGVIMGKDGGKFDPTGTATRAEVAAVLYRYVELVIDMATAQGLDKNDSGSVILYENGKTVKNQKRDIGGNAYNFNYNGEAVLIDPKQLLYTMKKKDSF